MSDLEKKFEIFHRFFFKFLRGSDATQTTTFGQRVGWSWAPVEF